MIFSVCFSPCGNFFVSGSRDKFVKFWQIKNENFNEICKLKLDSPVHSVEYLNNKKFLAGLENGKVCLLEIESANIKIVFAQQCFGKQVNKIRKHPIKEDIFACCSDDNTSRIYKIS